VTTSIVAVTGNPRPQSRTHTVARTLAGELARVLGTDPPADVDLAEIGAGVLDPGDERSQAATAIVLASDLLVLASPTYSATYSGLLKAFLDRLGTRPLAGKTAVPLLLGGAPNHQLAIDVHFTPLLYELGARVPVRGLFVVESDVPEFSNAAAVWAQAHAGTLLEPVLG
jgi:FMN reductase